MKLTPEQLAAIIAQIFANLIAAGKDPASITTEKYFLLHRPKKNPPQNRKMRIRVMTPSSPLSSSLW